MLIRHFMSRNVITLSASDSCLDAYRVFRKNGLRRAPVTRRGSVVGMITDRDLFRGQPLRIGDLDDLVAHDQLDRTVGDVMTRPVVHVAPNDHLEDAAKLMLDHRIGGMPVVENGELRGIITESEIFRVFVATTEPGQTTRITAHVPGHEATLDGPDAVAACVDTGVRLSGMLTYRTPEGHNVVLRVSGPRVGDLPDALRRHGFSVIEIVSPTSGGTSR